MATSTPEKWATDLVSELVGQRCDHGRFVRGKELAEHRRVAEISVSPGKVTALVYGSSMKPYDVTLRVPSQDGPPMDAHAFGFDCDCADWGDPCKHGVAVALALAAQFDANESLAEVWWGTPKLAPMSIGDAVEMRSQFEPIDLELYNQSAHAAPHSSATVLPSTMPQWAENLAPTVPARDVEEWLGQPTSALRPLKRPTTDAIERLADLGPLEVGEGWDLAPTMQLLVMHVIEPS